MKKGKNKIGIIFNTDPHDKPGSHWISLFINIKKKFIYFFDSTGDKPSNEIMKLVDRIIEQGHSISPSVNFKFHSNEGTEHQYGNTECGIYSLFFIIHMLQDKTPESFYKNHILTDKDVQHYRKIYFNQSL
jgi:Ulp1 family protease